MFGLSYTLIPAEKFDREDPLPLQHGQGGHPALWLPQKRGRFGGPVILGPDLFRDDHVVADGLTSPCWRRDDRIPPNAMIIIAEDDGGETFDINPRVDGVLTRRHPVAIEVQNGLPLLVFVGRNNQENDLVLGIVRATGDTPACAQKHLEQVLQALDDNDFCLATASVFGPHNEDCVRAWQECIASFSEQPLSLGKRPQNTPNASGDHWWRTDSVALITLQPRGRFRLS